MSAQEAALVVAVIGVTGTLVANLLTARAARRNAFVQELRTRTADAFKHAFVIQHAMEWVTWHAKYDPDSVSPQLKDDYAAEVHSAFPALQGAMASVASMSTGLHHEMQPVLDRLYAMEGDVALAIRHVTPGDSEREAGLDRLATLYDSAVSLYRFLPERFGEVMSLALTSRPEH